MITYAPDALIYNASDGTWQLRPDFNPVEHRVDLSINDADGRFDGDAGRNELGVDSTQSAVITDMLGNTIASGQIYDEEYYQITSDGVNFSYIDVVEMNGSVVAYFVDAPLAPNTLYKSSGPINVSGGNEMLYSSFAPVNCFGQGTLIATTEGILPIAYLNVGDRVITRDRGAQPVRAVDRMTLSAFCLRRRPDLRPVRLASEWCALPGLTETLTLSSNHRVLLADRAVDYLFGLPEALAAAGHLQRAAPVAPGETGITYMHLLFDHHELILANGIWCESLCKPAAATRVPASPSTPCLQRPRLVRPCLKRWETELLEAYCRADRDILTRAA